jgi:hypothetical protein
MDIPEVRRLQWQLDGTDQVPVENDVGWIFLKFVDVNGSWIGQFKCQWKETQNPMNHSFVPSHRRTSFSESDSQ